MKLIFTIVCVCVFAFTASAQSNCEQLKEDFGGFSICVPSGWKIAKQPGQIYRMTFGPLERGFSPNIIFGTEGNQYTLAEYVNGNVEGILAYAESIGYSNFRLKSRSKFVTNAKSVGVKVVWNADLQSLKLRTIQYYFAGKDGEKLVMTGTTVESRGAELELAFDRAARSLKLFDIIITPRS